jgi:beta-lactamase class A
MRRISNTLLLISLLFLAACSTPVASGTSTEATAQPATPEPASTPAPTATPEPTAAPSPTPTPPIAKGVVVAGVNVGGKTPEEARALLEQGLASALRPIDLRVADAQLTLQADQIGLHLDTDEMLSAAQIAKANARIPLKISIDRTLLGERLTEFARQVDTPGELTLITTTKSISSSFAIKGGAQLDIEAATQQIEERLQSPGAPRRVTLSLTQGLPEGGRPTPEQLQAQIEAMAKRWNGIVGIYVYDLSSEQVVAELNQDTVFSGASVMKVPILLQSYLNIKKFSQKHETWLRMMIVDSDNFSANAMLAASVAGSGTEDALVGALNMTKMLSEELGLQHTYQNMPYEASDYLIKVKKYKIKRGPPIEGPAPHTDPDPVLRTTPAEMSSIFLAIEQCRNGKGILLEKFEQLNPERCGEMISRLEKNGDKIRMRSGLPKNAVVAHKSGWIEDMQADVGIVRSPGGDFLVAIYVYKDIREDKVYLTDTIAAPVIGHFARLIYSYYNPVGSR